MKILLVSTLRHNPGDEIIRFGIENILRQVFPDAEYKIVHKHDPRTLFSGFRQRIKTPHRLLAPFLYRLYAATSGKLEENYLETADLVVFAGTPFIWRSSVRILPFTSENAEWVPAIWNRLFREFLSKPVLNLAAGTSVTDQKQYEAILSDDVVSNFLKTAVRRANLTTARDLKTQELLVALGSPTQVIPCASIMAAKGAGIAAQPPEYVVVNVMPSAAHSWRGQRGEANNWRETLGAVVADIEQRHSILFVSHSKEEDETAETWFPQHPRYFSRDPSELLSIYSKALYGFCNRIHAGGAIASFGRPVIVVGGDSRINLIQQFGMPAYDHREIDSAVLITAVREVEDNYDEYVKTLRNRIDFAEHEYIKAIQDARLSWLCSPCQKIG